MARSRIRGRGWAVEQVLSEPERDVEISRIQTRDVARGRGAGLAERTPGGPGGPLILDLKLTHATEARLTELGGQAVDDPGSLRAFIGRYLEEAAQSVAAA